MPLFADLHTHTKLCNHAVGDPLDYLRAAIDRNLAYYGISDHFPSPSGYDAQFRMMMLEYPIYRKIVREMREAAKGSETEVLYAVEFDYVPGRMLEVFDALHQEDFDYTIGSIHYIDGFAFDDPALKEEWMQRGVDHIWDRYTELLCDFVNGYNFNIIGHVDLPKKFAFYHSDPAYFTRKMRSVFEMAAAKGIMLELNTAGLRKAAKEIYPSLDLLKEAFAAGMGITFGSDAHAPNEIGADFDQALLLAKAAGYRCSHAFRAGKAIELPFD